jgi:hypothetical protein
VTELRCDPAGEQRNDNKEWIQMCKEMQVRTVWSDPTDKRSDGFAEQAVKMVELSGKSIMASNATPSMWLPRYIGISTLVGGENQSLLVSTTGMSTMNYY